MIRGLAHDGHLILDSISQNQNQLECRIMGKNLNDMMSITYGKVQFKDSLKFLPASLDKLCSNLKRKSGCLKSKFPSIYNHFQRKCKTFNESMLELLTQKQNFPYSYLTSFERLNDDKVPEKKYFFNDKSQFFNEKLQFSMKNCNLFNEN